MYNMSEESGVGDDAGITGPGPLTDILTGMREDDEDKHAITKCTGGCYVLALF